MKQIPSKVDSRYATAIKDSSQSSLGLKTIPIQTIPVTPFIHAQIFPHSLRSLGGAKILLQSGSIKVWLKNLGNIEASNLTSEDLMGLDTDSRESREKVKAQEVPQMFKWPICDSICHWSNLLKNFKVVMLFKDISCLNIAQIYTKDNKLHFF